MYLIQTPQKYQLHLHNLFSYLGGRFLNIYSFAAESADALAYMLSSASPPILHGDLKTANILLDGYFVAKVSNFGASNLAPNDEAEIATLVQGTCYLDPEYLLTCQLTDKSDVCSFAVIILDRASY
jgi:serine/threonine protein kinase